MNLRPAQVATELLVNAMFMVSWMVGFGQRRMRARCKSFIRDEDLMTPGS